MFLSNRDIKSNRLLLNPRPETFGERIPTSRPSAGLFLLGGQWPAVTEFADGKARIGRTKIRRMRFRHCASAELNVKRTHLQMNGKSEKVH